MANVWDRLPKRDDPYREAFRGEWGWFGRMRFEWHRERMARRLENNWNEKLQWRRTQRPEGIRHLIAGFLVIEGLVALVVGMALMFAYWPPVENGGMGDPIGFCGLGIVGASISYMIFVGLGVKMYNMLRPQQNPAPEALSDDGPDPSQEKPRGKPNKWSDEP